MRYTWAILICGGIVVAYLLIGAAVFGWEHGGGIIPMMILFAAVGAIWRKTTKQGSNDCVSITDNEESARKSPCESDSSIPMRQPDLKTNSHKHNEEKTSTSEKEIRQNILRSEEQANWFVLALLVVVFIVILLIRFSNTPSATQAKFGETDAHYPLGQVYLQSGNEYLCKGQYDLAISDFSKAIELNPSDSGAYSFRGLAHLQKGQNILAISDLTKSIEINPNNRVAYLCRGRAYSLRNQGRLAILDYTSAIELDESNAGTYFYRGNLYVDEGSYDLAISDYSKAIKLNPKDAVAYHNRGLAYGRKDQIILAISDYSKAIEINPRFADAYYGRAIKYAKIHESAKAWADVQMAQSLGHQADPKLLEILWQDSARER